MGLENEFKELEQDATGQGGNDGDNNANNANGSNDKTEDTMVDSGMQPRSLRDPPSPYREYKLTKLMQQSINSLPRRDSPLVSIRR